MRTPIIAGNWKMHKTVGEAVSLVEALKPRVAGRSGVEVVVCPPYTALAATRAALEGAAIRLGAQDVFWKESGAYTGRVAPGMLRDVGCDYVIIGHSETRGRFGVPDPEMTREILASFGENDATVNLKAKAALAHGLTPILCCGELLAERRDGRTDEVVRQQIGRGLDGLAPEQVGGLVLAYEPVWAIGTGEVCAPDEANRVCGVIRDQVRRRFGAPAAEAVRLQYGGSCKPDNAADLLRQPEIDGALVGGSSLKAEDFAAIVQAAPRETV
jgi:triosephosphate isomerase (TIM)